MLSINQLPETDLPHNRNEAEITPGVLHVSSSNDSNISNLNDSYISSLIF